jgi:hypothetical protein
MDSTRKRWIHWGCPEHSGSPKPRSSPSHYSNSEPTGYSTPRQDGLTCYSVPALRSTRFAHVLRHGYHTSCFLILAPSWVMLTLTCATQGKEYSVCLFGLSKRHITPRMRFLVSSAGGRTYTRAYLFNQNHTTYQVAGASAHQELVPECDGLHLQRCPLSAPAVDVALVAGVSMSNRPQ